MDLQSILKVRLKHAKTHAKRKSLQLEDSTLTQTELFEKWRQQNGRCHISGMDLTNDVSQISIERLKNNRAYHWDNIILVHRKFQVFHKSLHWTRKKYNEIFELRRQPILDQLFKEEDMESHLLFHEHDRRIFSRRKGTVKWIRHQNQRAAATYCGITKTSVSNHLHGIHKNRHFEFEAADHVPQPASFNIVFDKLRTMWYDSFQSTTSRNTIREKHNKPLHAQPTITPRSLWEQLKAQNFRCFYTGVPLAFEAGKDFMASLERLDENLGYTLENTRIIIVELNTAHYQWSHKDVEFHWPI